MTPIERRFGRIYEIGCICCHRRGWYVACQVHHLNLDQHAGQVRLGDESTIGLCPWHHVGEPPEHLSYKDARRILGPSMKHEAVKFREVFGSDEELLARENVLIAEREAQVVGRMVA